MDQPSNVSSTTRFQSGIEKLIRIGHSAASLSCEVQEAVALLTGTMQEDPDPAAVVDDLGGDTSSRLDASELMEIVNLETTRQALIRSWRYVESRKGAIIQQARTRTDSAAADKGVAE